MMNSMTWRMTIIMAILLYSGFNPLFAGEKLTREFYQLTEYQYSTDEQEKIIDDYLKLAYIPALHRAGIKKQVAVFKPVGNDTASTRRIFVLIPMASLEMLTIIQQKLIEDKAYTKDGTTYLNATYNSAPFSRVVTSLLQAFTDAPILEIPKLKGPKSERIYELRSYESPTEALHRNKVQMFNEGGEIILFKRLNFNAVFYGQVLAGNAMPNLMYITSFENIADREAHWKTFVEDPEWKKLSAMQEYQHNVSHIDITLLHTTDYSEL